MTEAPANTLEVITAKIKAALGNISANIVEIGQQLILAKAQLRHGQWLDWLADNFDMSDRTARNYIRIAEKFAKTENVFQFQPAALMVLAKLPDVQAFLHSNPDAKDLSVRSLRDRVKNWLAPAIPAPETIDVPAVISSATPAIKLFSPQPSLFPDYLPAVKTARNFSYQLPEWIIKAADKIPAPAILVKSRADFEHVATGMVVVALATTAAWLKPLLQRATALIHQPAFLQFTDGGESKNHYCSIFYTGDNVSDFGTAFNFLGAVVIPLNH